MKNIFELLLGEINNNRELTIYERNILNNINNNSFLLKRSLSKNEKKLLLRIIDNEGLLLENTAIRNFTDGFKLGIKLGIELFAEENPSF